jgi:hypothetical protein
VHRVLCSTLDDLRDGAAEARGRLCKDDGLRIVIELRCEFSDGHERLVTGLLSSFGCSKQSAFERVAAGVVLSSQSAASDVPKAYRLVEVGLMAAGKEKNHLGALPACRTYHGLGGPVLWCKELKK